MGGTIGLSWIARAPLTDRYAVPSRHVDDNATLTMLAPGAVKSIWCTDEDPPAPATGRMSTVGTLG